MLLLVALTWAVVVSCLEACAPGCQPLLGLSYDDVGASNEAHLPLKEGSCYFASPEASTPYLSVPPPAPAAAGPTPSFNYYSTSKWSSLPLTAAPSAQQPQQPGPILDLCNQVHSIWLTQGAQEVHGGNNTQPHIIFLRNIYMYLR